MLVVHHMIDALRGLDGRRPLMDIPGADDASARKMANLLEAAEKFDFGTLSLEPDEQGIWILPSLSDDERGFWVDGLIPLPASLCWFEFTLGNSRSGLIVSELDADRWAISRLDWTKPTMLFDNVWVAGSKAQTRAHGKFWAQAEGNRDFLLPMSRSDPFICNNLGACLPMTIYFALMLNSRTTEVEHAAVPSAKLNRRRMMRGRTPLPPHRIVTIVPARFRQETGGGGTHRPPRLHWRRSHLRHYDHNTLRSKWFPEAEHCGRRGWWIAVIARQLVGRAELGEVSHEYRVFREGKVAA